MGDGSIAAGGGPTATSEGQAPPGQVPAAPPTVLRRHVVLLGVAVAAITALALLLVGLATSPTKQFAPDSPEGAFQAYLTAWDARDLDGAYGTFSERVQRGLTIDEYRRMAWGFPSTGDAERRVVVLDRTVLDDRATLDLRVDELGGGGVFGAQSVWSRPLTVDLVREAGAWRLDMALANLEPVYWDVTK